MYQGKTVPLAEQIQTSLVVGPTERTFIHIARIPDSNEFVYTIFADSPLDPQHKQNVHLGLIAKCVEGAYLEDVIIETLSDIINNTSNYRSDLGPHQIYTLKASASQLLSQFLSLLAHASDQEVMPSSKAFVYIP